jgi:hypothetical protein
VNPDEFYERMARVNEHEDLTEPTRNMMITALQGKLGNLASINQMVHLMNAFTELSMFLSTPLSGAHLTTIPSTGITEQSTADADDINQGAPDE